MGKSKKKGGGGGGGGGNKVSSQTPLFGSIEDGDTEEFEECLAAGHDIHDTNKVSGRHSTSLPSP